MKSRQPVQPFYRLANLLLALFLALAPLLLQPPDPTQSASCTTASFGSATHFAAGNGPESVAVDDFNRDGACFRGGR